jgi:hypothetical protein
MARTKEAARKNVHDRDTSSSSSTSQRFLTPPSATTPNDSGNSSQKSLPTSDKNNEVQSTPTISITEMVTNLLHASNPQTTSQMMIGSVPINIPTIVAEKQTLPKETTSEPSKKPSGSSKKNRTKKSKSIDPSTIRRSNRIASGSKPVVDTTVYSISDSEDETCPPSPKHTPKIAMYARKKPSKSTNSPEEEEVLVKDSSPQKTKPSFPLIHEKSAESFKRFTKSKSILPGRIYDMDKLSATCINLKKFTEPLGWTNVFKIKEIYYPDLILAFYFNVVVHSDKDLITSDLKGNRVRITEKILGELLNLPTEGAKLYGSDWYSIAGVDKTELMSLVYQPDTVLDDPPSSKLKSDFKIIHNICLHSIFPEKEAKTKSLIMI